jgi:hypothetical protein
MEFLILSIVGAFFGWRRRKTPRKTDILNEEQRILSEVSRLKERARQSGIITSVFQLVRENLPYYDAWLKNCPEVVHPQIRVTNQAETRDGDKSTERIDAVIRGDTYSFVFTERTYVGEFEPHTTGQLEVYFQGQRVITIECSCEIEEYVGSVWSPQDVSAFIDGPWVAELNSVFAEITRLRGQQRARAEEASKKQTLQDLKKNFGL